MGCTPFVGRAPMQMPMPMPMQTLQMPVQTMPVQMPMQSAQVPAMPVNGGQPQAAPRPVMNTPAPMLASAEPRPKVRLQAPDEPVQPAATRLTLPPPEQFGIGAKPVAATAPVAPAAETPAAPAVDWNITKQRLDRLNAVAFHSDRLAPGGFRISVLLPTRDGTHHIEAEAGSEAAAVAIALERAETWALQR